LVTGRADPSFTSAERAKVLCSLRHIVAVPCAWKHGDAKTWNRGDVGTWGRGDVGTHMHGGTGSRRHSATHINTVHTHVHSCPHGDAHENQHACASHTPTRTRTQQHRHAHSNTDTRTATRTRTHERTYQHKHAYTCTHMVPMGVCYSGGWVCVTAVVGRCAQEHRIKQDLLAL
jgi:hypothetical protein